MEQETAKPNRRQMQAAQTRRDIILAATQLFTERGYARTSVADIAARAGVSVQTIYSSVGQKAQLITAMLDEIDSIAGIPELARQAAQATDAREIVGFQARITRQLNERCRDILAGVRSASAVDPDLAAAYAAGNARHVAGVRLTVERLAAVGALALGVDQAVATVSVLTSIDVYTQLTTDHGLSFDDCEAWVRTTLETVLLSR
ncbi:AcrR family transcriptional regulator [Hamadaea flava]|uniref:TetR/AcrR family transcriptional regulator n=1 Tax=Hamadaea flava TaxID=1742688 RepID=A0ABV8M0B5_9ACTN|nr:TetR/AcrR family transcriptional regulator [Hamadaea flava]MCP2328954.1 AcrR family transcriptional regulator [Hamadaea flava]